MLIRQCVVSPKVRALGVFPVPFYSVKWGPWDIRNWLESRSSRFTVKYDPLPHGTSRLSRFRFGQSVPTPFLCGLLQTHQWFDQNKNLPCSIFEYHGTIILESEFVRAHLTLQRYGVAMCALFYPSCNLASVARPLRVESCFWQSFEIVCLYLS